MADGTTTRTDRRAMGAAGSAAAAATAGDRPTRQGPPHAWSTASCGGWRPGSPGATCRSGTARGRRCTPRSGAGSGPGSGTGCWPRSRPRPTRPGRLDWSLHFVDGSTVRAHQHAAGAKKGGGDQALGRSRGGFSTKIHLRAERRRQADRLRPDGRAAPRGAAVPALLDAGRGPAAGPGPPPPPPGRVAGDKGYSGRAMRATAPARHRAVIPRRDERRQPPLRPGGLPRAQPRRAAHQPPQAAPRHRHPLREAEGDLPCPAHHRLHPLVVVSLQTRPSTKTRSRTHNPTRN